MAEILPPESWGLDSEEIIPIIFPTEQLHRQYPEYAADLTEFHNRVAFRSQDQPGPQLNSPLRDSSGSFTVRLTTPPGTRSPADPATGKVLAIVFGFIAVNVLGLIGAGMAIGWAIGRHH